MPVSNASYVIPQLGIIKEILISKNRDNGIKYWQEIPTRGIKSVIPESDFRAAVEGLDYFSEKSPIPFNTVKSWANELDLPKALDALESVFGKNRVPTPIYNAVIFANSKRYRDEVVNPMINQDITLALLYAEQGNREAAHAALKIVDGMVKQGKRFSLDLTSRL